MNEEILERARTWVENPHIDEKSRNEIKDLLDQNQHEEIISRFYTRLQFGTAGMRGKIGAGLNRFNIYQVRQVSQGLASYVLQQAPKEAKASIAIAHDNRHFSDVFTREAASVFAANGLKVHLFPELHATPMLSYAVRELQTTAGIVITASHNPPQYNGYKVYWSDGAQITDPHDKGIMDCISEFEDYSRIKTMSFETALAQNVVEYIPETLDQKYFSEIEKICLGSTEKNSGLGVVYTPLHGTGAKPVREIFTRRGFKNIVITKEQEQPDPDFPTVEFPNPEEVSALLMSKNAASSSDQLILATDPDSDRIGAMVRDQDDWLALNGNQIGALLLDYYLRHLQNSKKMPADAYVISTVVTSELIRKITESYGLVYRETLTGFKNIAQIIRTQEAEKNGTFLFGMEEAHGYLFSDFVRDKDGISTAVIFAEMVAELQSQQKTPLDALQEIHQKLGFHQDSLINHVLEGKEGAEQILQIMKNLRSKPPLQIAGRQVILRKDHQENQVLDCLTGKVTGKINLGISNVLGFYLEDGSRITARPSGTEPKIKFYFNLCQSNQEGMDTLKQEYETDFMNLIQKY